MRKTTHNRANEITARPKRPSRTKTEQDHKSQRNFGRKKTVSWRTSRTCRLGTKVWFLPIKRFDEVFRNADSTSRKKNIHFGGKSCFETLSPRYSFFRKQRILLRRRRLRG